MATKLAVAPTLNPIQNHPRPHQLLVLSAHSLTGLDQITDNLAHFLTVNPDITLTTG